MWSSAVGTFLSALGIDLLINRQAGMSFGLRFLFDRNSTHMVVSATYFLRWCGVSSQFTSTSAGTLHEGMAPSNHDGDRHGSISSVDVRFRTPEIVNLLIVP